MDTPTQDGGENSALAALNRRQLLFVLEYARCGIGKRAAIDAGYSPASAEKQASVLLSDSKVSAALAEIASKVITAAKLDLERTCAVLASIITADPAEALDVDGGWLPFKDWPWALRQATSGLEFKEIWSGRGEDREQTGRVVKVRFNGKNDAIKTMLTQLGALQGKGENAINFYDLVLQTQKKETP